MDDSINLNGGRPAVFLDRDGVLNVPPPPGDYILDPAHLKLEMGAARAVKRLHNAGYFLVVATNQRCVGRGLIDTARLEQIHARLQQLLREKSGHTVDAIYYSPDDRNTNSPTRKPAPGMLLQAGKDHRLDLAKSWMIGDSMKDVGAALAAGVRPILIEHPDTAELRGFMGPDVAARTHIVRNIGEAVSVILTGRAANLSFLG